MNKTKNKISINFFIIIAITLVMPIVISFSFIANKVNIKSETKCDCEYRCMVKCLSDTESKKIVWIPKATNVNALYNLAQPFPVEETNKKRGHDVKKIDKSLRFGFEYNIYDFNCRVKDILKEDGGDYIIYISDIKDSTITIVGRVPNPECDYVKKSPFVNSFKKIREEIDIILNSEKFNIHNSTFLITGVCFFNEKNKAGICPVMDMTRTFRSN